MALKINVTASLDKASSKLIAQNIKDIGQNAKIQISRFSIKSDSLQNSLSKIKGLAITVDSVRLGANAQKDIQNAINSVASKTSYNGDGSTKQYKDQINQNIAKQQANTKLLAEIDKQYLQSQKQEASLEHLRTQQQSQRTKDQAALIRAQNSLLRAQQKNDDFEISSNFNEEILNIKKTKLSYSFQDYRKRNSKAEKYFSSDLDNLNVAIESIKNNADLSKVNVQFSALKSKIKAAGKEGKSFADQMKKAFSVVSRYFSADMIINKSISYLKQAVQNVYEIDTAMINLKKVTDETSSTYDQFLTRASDKAKELGRTVSGMVEQTATWAKLGFSLPEAEELSKVSAIYANVGEVSDETAVSDLVTAMKAFKKDASEAMTIVDALNELGNNYATSASALGDGLSRSASAMSMAGNDLNQTLAMLTGGTEITQNASEMGNALKIFAMRIRGIKLMPPHKESLCAV